MNCTAEIHGVEVEVTYSYIPPSRGARDSLGGIPGAGAPLEPDDPAEIVVDAVEVNGVDIKDLLSGFAMAQAQARAVEVFKEMKLAA